MNYRSVAELNDTVVRWAGALPRDIELVVGVPRSGLLVANLLSMYLNLPMTDVDGLMCGRILRSGARYRGDCRTVFLSTPRNVLIVDDSVSYGGQMALVRAEVARANLEHRVDYGAVYVTPEARDERLVNYFGEVVSRPRVFEWNLMHHESLLARSCVSLEGVICPSNPRAGGRGGKSGHTPLEGVEPLWVPDHPVGWLVSTGSEARRPGTEAWLASKGVVCEKLVMRGEDEGWPEREGEKDVWFKAEVYASSGADLFLEGSLEVSCKVAKLTGRPVSCVAPREMVRPGMSPRHGRRLQSPLTWWAVQAYHRIVRVPRLAAKRLAGRIRRYTGRERFPAAGATGTDGGQAGAKG
jgi:orotate phosphoribosyltransferase